MYGSKTDMLPVQIKIRNDNMSINITISGNTLQKRYH